MRVVVPGVAGVVVPGVAVGVVPGVTVVAAAKMTTNTTGHYQQGARTVGVAASQKQMRTGEMQNFFTPIRYDRRV